jgi:hypothetical protein
MVTQSPGSNCELGSKKLGKENDIYSRRFDHNYFKLNSQSNDSNSYKSYISNVKSLNIYHQISGIYKVKQMN